MHPRPPLTCARRTKSNIKIDSGSYSNLIETLYKSRRPDLASKVFSDYKTSIRRTADAPPQPMSDLVVAVVLRGLDYSQDYAAAVALFNEVRTRRLGKAPSNSPLTPTPPLLSLARSFARSLAQASSTPSSISPFTVSAALMACGNEAKRRPLDNADVIYEAERVFDAIKGGKVNSVMANNMISLYSSASLPEDRAKMWSVLEFMEQGGVRPNIITFGTLMAGCDSWADATRVLDEMDRRNTTANE
jgi:hypothetical protein